MTWISSFCASELAADGSSVSGSSCDDLAICNCVWVKDKTNLKIARNVFDSFVRQIHLGIISGQFSSLLPGVIPFSEGVLDCPLCVLNLGSQSSQQRQVQAYHEMSPEH